MHTAQWPDVHDVAGHIHKHGRRLACPTEFVPNRLTQYMSSYMTSVVCVWTALATTTATNYFRLYLASNRAPRSGPLSLLGWRRGSFLGVSLARRDICQRALEVLVFVLGAARTGCDKHFWEYPSLWRGSSYGRVPRRRSAMGGPRGVAATRQVGRKLDALGRSTKQACMCRGLPPPSTVGTSSSPVRLSRAPGSLCSETHIGSDCIRCDDCGDWC